MTIETLHLPALAGTLAEAHAEAGDSAALPIPSDEALITRAHPAAESMARVGRYFNPNITATDMIEDLQIAQALDGDGAHALFEQAQVLDQMFHRLVVGGIGAKNRNGEDMPDYISTDMVDLALRAQKLCRTALHMRHTLQQQKNKQSKKLASKLKDV